MGRNRERSSLTAALESAVSGRGSLWLIEGDAGTGKTHLAETVFLDATESGLATVWSQCWDGAGAPPLWPAVQLLRGVDAECDARDVLEHMGPAAADLVRALLGDSTAPDAVPADSERALFYLFDAVATFVVGAADKRPVLCVIDDLHLADESSLRLFAFLADRLRSSRILAVATVGDALDESSVTLGSIRRRASTVVLGPLDEDASTDLVGRLWAARGGDRPLEEATRERIVDAAQGNPFFIEELVHAVSTGRERMDTGGSLEVPRGIRDAVASRLSTLAQGTLDVLRAGAVLGREFRLDAIARALGMDERTVRLAAGRAVDAGVIHADADTPLLYSFVHRLVRDALYADIPDEARADIHGRLGEALESLHISGPAELAHHFSAAAHLGRADAAIRYEREAGDAASGNLAYPDAARHYERALAALDLGTVEDHVLRADLLLALGHARRRGGDVHGSREAFSRAADVVRGHADGRRLAEAALGYGAVWTQLLSVDAAFIQLLEDALAVIDEQDVALRVRLQARLAAALYWSDQTERRMSLARRAIETARELGDRATLASVLHRSHWALWVPGNTEERLRMATETVGLAMEARDPETELEGRMWRIVALLESGVAGAADNEIRSYERVAARLGQPYFLRYTAQFATLRAVMDGRFEDAEIHLQSAFELGTAADDQNALAYYGVQLAWLRSEQGRSAEIEGLLRAYAATPDGRIAGTAALAVVYSETGRDDLARELVGEVARDDFAQLRQDATLIPLLCIVGEAALRSGSSRDILEGVSRRLLPHRNATVVVGHGLACYGAAARYLGLLALALGRGEEAVELLQEAVDRHDRMQLRPLSARARVDLARAWIETGGEPGIAARLVAEARRLAEQLESPRGIAEAEGAESMLDSSGRRVADPVASSSLDGVFRREGEVWHVALGGPGVRLRDSKGVRCLRFLVANPGREVPAVALAAIGEEHAPEDADVAAAILAGGGEPILDEPARAAILERMSVLREELSDAEAFHDDLRADRARDELDQLASALSRSTRPGGSSRRAGSAAERARVNVTRSIRTAIQRMADHDQALARHLSDSVKTGNWCSYDPDPARPVRWNLG